MTGPLAGKAHIGGASIDGLIEREGPTGDERDIVVAAGEAAGGRDRADCGDSAHGEIIDVVELERAGDGRAHGVHIIGIVREAEGPAAAEIEFIGGDGAGRALSDGAIGLQAHIGGASIDGLIEREGPTGDERDIVVAAGEAAGGRDRADCGDSAHGEIIDVIELERAGDGRAHGVHIIGIVREAEGPAAAEIEFIGGDGAGRALSDGAIGLQAHIGGASIDGLIEREGPTGDEGDIVVTAAEATDGSQAADRWDSPDCEAIDIGELNSSRGIGRDRVNVVGTVRQRVGTSSLKAQSTGNNRCGLRHRSAGGQGHIRDTGVDTGDGRMEPVAAGRDAADDKAVTVAEGQSTNYRPGGERRDIVSGLRNVDAGSCGQSKCIGRICSPALSNGACACDPQCTGTDVHIGSQGRPTGPADKTDRAVVRTRERRVFYVRAPALR